MAKKHNLLAGILAASMALGSGCAVSSDGYNRESVFGSISISSNGKAGDIGTVNGGVDIGNKAIVEDIETVNGGIDLGNGVQLSSASTVNGSIEAGIDLKVQRSLETVNGDITLKSGGVVGSDVETVNGDIELTKSEVGGDVETVTGDVILVASKVKGDIVFERRSNWFFEGSKPELNIDEDSVVEGDIHLYQKVRLSIEEGAKVGKIHKHYKKD